LMNGHQLCVAAAFLPEDVAQQSSASSTPTTLVTIGHSQGCVFAPSPFYT
jgi:hypothetical protein